jgi:putative acetyltransferase
VAAERLTPTDDPVFAIEDPRTDDVRRLLEAHLAFARSVTPPGHVHALDLEALVDPAVSLYCARRNGELLGVGALKRLDATHAEIKSMHVTEAARGQGIGRAMVQYLLSEAAARNCRRVSLETGTMEAFAPARSLYSSVGFTPCEPFGEYTDNPFSTCMTIVLDPETGIRR